MAATRRGLVGRRLLVRGGLVSAVAGLGLSGCSDDGADPAPANDPETTGDPGRSAPSGSRLLVVYFSRPGENYWYGGRRTVEVGFTEVLAGMIAERVECDTYRIVAADAYPSAYDPTVDRNSQEQDDDARPRIRGTLPDLAAYDTLLIGSPVWGSRAPMIMSTLVESVDLSGKRVLPFVTYAVSGMAGIDERYREVLPDSSVTEGLAVQGEKVRDSGPTLDGWLAAHL